MQPSYRIVVAEDEPVLLSLFERMIRRLEPTAIVWGCQNGLDALHSYEHEWADLLIVSHELPGLDGPMLISTLRARGDTVPIIWISGNLANREVQVAAGTTVFVESTALVGELPALLARFKPGCQEE